jgi:hypothetical protein
LAGFFSSGAFATVTQQFLFLKQLSIHCVNPSSRSNKQNASRGVLQEDGEGTFVRFAHSSGESFPQVSNVPNRRRHQLTDEGVSALRAMAASSFVGLGTWFAT